MTDGRIPDDEPASDEFAHSSSVHKPKAPEPKAPAPKMPEQQAPEPESADLMPEAQEPLVSDALIVEERQPEHADEADRPTVISEPPMPPVGAEPESESVISGETVPAPTTVAKKPRASRARKKGAEPSNADAPTPAKQPGAKTERAWLVPALGTATAVLLVVSILLGLMAFAPSIAPIKSSATKLAVKAEEEDSLKTIAKRFATNFVSIDYRTIDADVKRMTDDATSAFAEQLQRTVDAIAPQFKARKAGSSGRALDAAVLSHEKDNAIVQVLLRRTKRNVGTKGAQTGNQVVNVTLVKTADGWKVSDLAQLGAEGQQ